MTYFDERRVSRIFDVSVGEGTVAWRRDDRELSQSVTITADRSGDILVCKGRKWKNGGAWADDLSQVYRREGRDQAIARLRPRGASCTPNRRPE